MVFCLNLNGDWHNMNTPPAHRSYTTARDWAHRNLRRHFNEWGGISQGLVGDNPTRPWFPQDALNEVTSEKGQAKITWAFPLRERPVKTLSSSNLYTQMCFWRICCPLLFVRTCNFFVLYTFGSRGPYRGRRNWMSKRIQLTFRGEIECRSPDFLIWMILF